MIIRPARIPQILFVVSVFFSGFTAFQPASAAVVLNNGTPGYYNNSLGGILNGSQPQFPLDYPAGGDPTIDPAAEPDLTPAATVLGGWLAPVPVRNGNWGALGPVPTTWGSGAETAIIYEVDGGPAGLTNVVAQLDVDNGIFVWVNGHYKFGAVSGGSPSPTGQFEYTNVVLGTLAPGTNYLQVLLEDNGFFTGYQILVTGEPIPSNPPVITQHPESQVAPVGQSVSFSVVVNSPGITTYQWWYNSQALAEATNATLVLTNAQPNQAGVYSVTVANSAGSAISSNAFLTFVPPEVILVDGNTLGYYNSSLGTILDGTQPQFPDTFPEGGDPTIDPANEPNLSAAASILGDWLSPQPVLNGFWSALTPIPAGWDKYTETAIIYEVDAGPTGLGNVLAQLDVDNGIFVWVNGQYKFGAVAGGSPSPIGQFEYTNVVLGALSPGTNYLQILREDNGIFNGYQIRVTGQAIVPPPVFGPAQWVPGSGFLMTLNVAAGRSYQIEYVSDLGDTNWITLTNFISSSSLVRVVDPTVTARRWYRAVMP